MLHTCKSVPKGGGSDFFEKLFCQKTTLFAIEYQENTTICLLQPKIVGRNYLWANNWYIMFIRFIIQNNTAHHFCKNLYLKYTVTTFRPLKVVYVFWYINKH